MSNKQNVLIRIPTAYAYKWSGGNPWTIYFARPGFPRQGESIAHGARTAAEAWKMAHDNIKAGKVLGI